MATTEENISPFLRTRRCIRHALCICSHGYCAKLLWSFRDCGSVQNIIPIVYFHLPYFDQMYFEEHRSIEICCRVIWIRTQMAVVKFGLLGIHLHIPISAVQCEMHSSCCTGVGTCDERKVILWNVMHVAHDAVTRNMDRMARYRWIPARSIPMGEYALKVTHHITFSFRDFPRPVLHSNH